MFSYPIILNACMHGSSVEADGKYGRRHSHALCVFVFVLSLFFLLLLLFLFFLWRGGGEGNMHQFFRFGGVRIIYSHILIKKTNSSPFEK